MKLILPAAILSALAIATVSHACTLPSGAYVGVGDGLIYSGSTATNVMSTSMAVTIASNGSGTVVEAGKTMAGRYSSNATIPARGTAGNTFNTTTCVGVMTLSTGKVYLYTVADLGAEIHLMYYGNDTTSYNYSVSLRRQ